jgi:hypothetical protein
MNSILFDIGGTKMRVAYSANGESFEEPKVVPTPKNYEEGKQAFLNLIEECRAERPVDFVVGGMSRSVVGLPFEQFKSDLIQIFGEKFLVENDAAMVGLGEAVFGAGKGQEIVAYITVSTGVGGARVVAGRLDERAVGFEPGKQIIDLAHNQTLEDLVSGRALETKFGRRPKEILENSCLEKEFNIFAQRFTTFPNGLTFSEETRKMLEHCCQNVSNQSLDDKLLEYFNTEYRLFQTVERQLCQTEVGRLFKDIDDFLKTASSIMNRRKSRAGRSLENHIDFLLKESGVPHEMQASIAGSKPDIIIPSKAAENHICYLFCYSYFIIVDLPLSARIHCPTDFPASSYAHGDPHKIICNGRLHLIEKLHSLSAKSCRR